MVAGVLIVGFLFVGVPIVFVMYAHRKHVKRRRELQQELKLKEQSYLGELYSPNQVAIASFFGTLLAGAVLVSLNFRHMGRPDTAQKALLWGIATMIMVLLLAIFLPDNFPNYVLPIIYVVAMQRVAQRYQGKEYKHHIESGGLKGSPGAIAGITLGCVVATVVVFFVLALIVTVIFPTLTP